jgi:hypothetical protein
VADQVNQQDNDNLTEGARVVASGVQGTLKTWALDGQLNASGTEGKFKTAAVDGTVIPSVMAVPQKQ